MHMVSKSISFFVILLSILPLYTFGQIKDDVIIITFDLVVDGFTGPENNKHEFVVKGTPYLDRNFKPGKILIGKAGENEREGLMRFNAYRDHIEINQNGTKAFVAQASDVKVVLDGTTYAYLKYIERGNSKTGYFNLLHEGETQLYAKIQKVIPKTDFPDHGYETFEPPSFVTETTYYIKRKNRAAEKLRHLSRKEVFAILWDKYSELRAFARKNKFNVRTVEDTIQILTYYDELQKQDQESDMDQ